MSNGLKVFLATFVVILLLIFGIVLITRGGGSSSDNVTVGGKPGLVDYADNTNAEVRYTLEGPINAAEQHRTVRMSVSPTIRQIDVIRGYEGEVIDRKTYDNNSNAYKEFLEALQRAGFTQEKGVKGNASSAAICPLGNRTHYQLVEKGENRTNLWSASCAQGSFGGNASLTTSLFQMQFPDYGSITSNVNISGSGGGGTGLVL